MINIFRRNVERFFHGNRRNGKHFIRDFDEQRVHNRQREREFQHEFRALPGMGAHVNFPLHAVNMLAHDVEAKPAPGDVVHRLGRAETGMKQEFKQFLLADRFDVAVRKQAVFQRAVADALALNPLPVVAHGDENAVAFLRGGNRQRPGRIFAEIFPLFRRLDAVMNGVLR